MEGLRELISYWDRAIERLEDDYQHEECKSYNGSKELGRIASEIDDALDEKEEDINRYMKLNHHKIEHDLARILSK